MKFHVRTFLVPLILLAIFHLDVAVCPGQRPSSYEIVCYNYQDGKYEVVDSFSSSRYSEYKVNYQANEVDGYTFVGFVIENTGGQGEVRNIDEVLPTNLGDTFTIYVDSRIYPCYIQNDKLEEFKKSDDSLVRFSVGCINPTTHSVEYIQVEAHLFDQLKDIKDQLPKYVDNESILGYTFGNQFVFDENKTIDYTFQQKFIDVVYRIENE